MEARATDRHRDYTACYDGALLLRMEGRWEVGPEEV